jgi:hypothetical protein
MTSIAISFAAPTPRAKTSKSVIAGRIMSGIITALLLADASIKFVTNNTALIEGAQQLGYSLEIMPVIGTVLLLCVLLYAIPRTSVFGALLLTGYLGGAVATHVRVGNPLFSHILFPTYVAVMVWGGLYLRNPKLRALVRG